MKRVLLFFLSCCLASFLFAQELKVKSFGAMSNDLSASTNRRKDLNGKPCALVKVTPIRKDAIFKGSIIGETEMKGSEYWVYMPEGTKMLQVQYPGCETLMVNFQDEENNPVSLVSNVTYVLVLIVPNQTVKSEFYADLGFQAGTGLLGPALSVGTYIGGFNIEANAVLPMNGGETVYCQEGEQEPLEFNYKPSFALGARLGYGISVGKKMRLTPQIGLMYMGTKETAVSNTTLTPAKGANCASLCIDCRLQYMLSKNIGISLTPEYAIPIAKSKGFTALSEVSNNIKKWNNGISGRLSLFFQF